MTHLVTHLPPARRWLLLLLPALLGLLALLSWYALPVRQVVVQGNQALSQEAVLSLSRLPAPQGAWWGRGGWLYLGERHFAELADHPYVARLEVLKVFPGTVVLRVQERSPAAWHVTSRGRQLVAEDGTVLTAPPSQPHAQHELPSLTIQGYGKGRLSESLAAARMLARYDVTSVTYSPWGLTIVTARGTFWGGSLGTIRLYAEGVNMIETNMNVYPWGVSSQQ